MAPPPRRQQVAIVFGYDGAEYTTSTGEVNGQGSISGHARARSDDNLNKECHVVFGEPGREKRDFTIASTQANPTGEMHKYTALLPSDTKHMLVKTSSSYGTDPPNYTTSTHQATYYSKAAAQESIALRNEIRKRTGPRPTRGMSYDDEIEYVSESKSQFENKCKDHKPSVMAEAVKNDLRATHFSLGHEKLEYRTSSHIDRLSPEEFTKYATRQTPPHDLRKSAVEIL